MGIDGRLSECSETTFELQDQFGRRMTVKVTDQGGRKLRWVVRKPPSLRGLLGSPNSIARMIWLQGICTSRVDLAAGPPGDAEDDRALAQGWIFSQRLLMSNTSCGLSNPLAITQKLVVVTFSRLDHSKPKSIERRCLRKIPNRAET